jgi:hypothetical protein
MKFLLASLLILKVIPNAASNFSSGFPLLSLVNFSSDIQSRLSEQFSESQAGFRTTFKDTGGYQKAGTSSLKRVFGRVTADCRSDSRPLRSTVVEGRGPHLGDGGRRLKKAGPGGGARQRGLLSINTFLNKKKT